MQTCYCSVLAMRSQPPGNLRQPKASHDPTPKPAHEVIVFFMGRVVSYTHGNGATDGAKVIKNDRNSKYDIQFQQDGTSVVRLSLPRAKLQIA